MYGPTFGIFAVLSIIVFFFLTFMFSEKELDRDNFFPFIMTFLAQIFVASSFLIATKFFPIILLSGLVIWLICLILTINPDLAPWRKGIK